MTKTTVHQVLATNLKRWREAKGMTQTQLGDKAGCGQAHISRIEKVKMPTGPTVEALSSIAAALGLQAWELLVDSDATRQEALRRMIAGSGDVDRAGTAPTNHRDSVVVPLMKRRPHS